MSADTNDVPRRLYTGILVMDFNVSRSNHPTKLVHDNASRCCLTEVRKHCCPRVGKSSDSDCTNQWGLYRGVDTR